MITIKTLQQNPYFSGLAENQLNYLISVALQLDVKQGEYVCENNKKIDHFFLVQTGKLEVLFEVPKIHTDFDSPRKPPWLEMELVRFSQLHPGEICGWSALVPPHIATSSVVAVTDSTLTAFNSKRLLSIFQEDCSFGYIMLQAAAQAIGKRIKAIYDLPEQV